MEVGFGTRVWGLLLLLSFGRVVLGVYPEWKDCERC